MLLVRVLLVLLPVTIKVAAGAREVAIFGAASEAFSKCDHAGIHVFLMYAGKISIVPSMRVWTASRT